MSSFEIDAKRLSTLADLQILDTAPEPSFDQLTELARDLFDVPISLISLIDKERQWFKSCIGLDVSSTPREMAFCDVAIRADEVMIVADATLDDRFKSNPLVTGAPNIRFYAGAPVRFNDVLIGTLCIIDRKARLDFGENDARRLQKLAAAVSSVLQMRKEAATNIAILKSREKAQKTIGLMEDVAGVGQWSFDVKSGDVWWSDQVFEIHGLPVSEKAPAYSEIVKTYSGDDAEKLQALVKHAVTTGEGYHFTAKIRRSDGNLRDIVARAVTLCDRDGQVETLFGVFQDVTEYQSVIEGLAVSEARYKLLADNANDLVLRCHIDGTVAYASPSAVRITGFTAEQLLGRKWCELVHPDDAAQLPATIRSLAKDGAVAAEQPLEYRFVHRTAGVRHFAGQPTIIYDPVTGDPTGFVTIIRDVTDTVEAREKLVKSEAQLHLLADNVPGIVGYWDSDLKCRYANIGFKSWFNRTPQEMIGMDLEAILGADLFGLNEPYIRAALNGHPQYFERKLTQASGEVVHTIAQYVPDIEESGIVRGFYVLVTDITNLKLKELALAESNAELIQARQQAEAALEQLEASEAQLRALADHVPGKVAYWDADLRCRFANQLFRNWFERSSGDIIGMSMQAFMGDAAFAEDEAYVRSALAGEQVSFERKRIRPSGDVAYLWVQYIPSLAADGAVAGFYALATDVTALKVKEFALATANARLIEARQQAEDALEIKAQFLATMSHEIRTPLTTILGYANLLDGHDELSEEAASFVKRIGKAGRTLLGLVNDVLDVSRLEAGQVKLSPQAVNVRALIQDIVDQFQGLAGTRNLSLTLAFDEDVPQWQMIDDTRLSQVLNNLIGNACKFTCDGSIRVDVTMSEMQNGTRVRFEVSDSGPGLNPEQTCKLFKRFQQLDAGINRKHSGSGLGLAICAEVIKLMRGEIGVISTVELGSTFWFEIPLAETAPVAAEPDPYRIVDFDIANRTVLLVDDHAVNRQMIKALILPFTEKVEEAADGAEAIALCRATKFDLVFMDIQMPTIDGVTATEAIRATCPLNSQTPIIALTAMTKNRWPEGQSGALFNQVLAKPIDPRKLHAVLAALATCPMADKRKVGGQ